MKRNILYTGLIAATTLLTLGSCYDLDEMNRDRTEWRTMAQGER